MIGISMTITSHAMVMYSSTGIYMFVFGIIIGNTMHKLEYFGMVMYLLGVFLMLTDPFAIKIGGEGNQLVGDAIAFIGASAGAMLGYYNSKTSKVIHPLVFLTHVLVISSIYQITFFIIKAISRIRKMKLPSFLYLLK